MAPVYTHFQTKKAHLYCLHKGVPLPGAGGGEGIYSITT